MSKTSELLERLERIKNGNINVPEGTQRILDKIESN
jgi:hypothetical protein